MQQAVNGNVQARDAALERTVQTARDQVELEQKLERSRADFEACEAQLLQLQHHSSLRQEHQELQQSHNCLQMEHKQLQTGHAGVAQAREQLTSDVENLRREMLQKLQERDEHISTIVDLRADAEKRLEAKQGELDRLVADFEQERRASRHLATEILDFKLQDPKHMLSRVSLSASSLISNVLLFSLKSTPNQNQAHLTPDGLFPIISTLSRS